MSQVAMLFHQEINSPYWTLFEVFLVYIHTTSHIQRQPLLFTVIDVLEAVANDTDIMQSISTEFTTVGAAYKYIEQRIGQIKDKIASIPEPDEEYSCFSLMYTRGDDTPARIPSTGGGGGSCDCEDTTSISNLEIDKWF